MDCIERFLSNNSEHIKIVNFNNFLEMENFKEHFRQNMANKFVYPENFSKKDELFNREKFLFNISSEEENIFAFGFTSQLKFLGEDVLRNFFYRILRVDTEKLVFVAYQCEDILKDLIERDLRNKRFIILSEGSYDKIPKIEFVTNVNLCKNEDVCDGIDIAYKKIESSEDIIYIKTDKKKEEFLDSIYSIQNQKNAFSKLCADFPEIKNQCSEDFCTSEQWERILEGALKKGSIDDYITSTLKNSNRFEEKLFDPSCDIEKKSLCFMNLKLHRETQKEYLKYVIENCKNVFDFSKAVFNNILDYDCNNSSFSKIYDERKNYLDSLGKYSEEIEGFAEDFCLAVKKKGKDYIKYLTDCTVCEKQAIIENICVFVNEYSEKKILDILQKVYPDLYLYLQNYDLRFKEEDFTDYISKYKMCKLTNKITDEFLALEKEEAEKRIYFKVLEPRASIVSDIKNKDNSSLFFVDSLGIEYIAFIFEKLRAKGLQAKISIGICNLPSITSLNKEFLNEKWGKTDDKKTLDILKHNKDFKYSLKEPPFYIVEELKIIDDILEKIRRILKKNAFEKVVLLSDHGSSRLCVISENGKVLEMKEKGEHSGRFCPVDEINACPKTATEAQGYWILANYDSFKGGRISGLEVHGGASIEEVLVPVIEISLADNKIKIDMEKEFTFSPLNDDFEEFEFFSHKKLQNVTVNLVLGNDYNKDFKADSIDGYNFKVNVSNLDIAGEYTFSVFANGKKIFETVLNIKKKKGSTLNSSWI